MLASYLAFRISYYKRQDMAVKPISAGSGVSMSLRADSAQSSECVLEEDRQLERQRRRRSGKCLQNWQLGPKCLIPF
jgi:hypothetical protein